MFEKSPILIVIEGFRAFWLDPHTARVIPLVRGGDGPLPAEDAPPEIPSDFTALADDDLRSLHAKLEERFTAEKADAKTKAQVDALKAYREAQGRIVAEVTRRQTEAAEVTEALKALDTSVDLPPEEEPAPADDAADKDKPAEDAPAAPAPEAMAAALTADGIAAARAPQTAAEQAPVAHARPRMAMTAAAGQQVVPFGQEVDLDRIGAIVDKIKYDLKPNGRENVKAFVASVGGYEDMGSELGTAILSTANGAQRNDALIREAVEAHMARRAERMGRQPKAQTAAICDPLDIIREIPDYVSQADPISSVFPSRPISRLGFNYTPAIALSAVEGGVFVDWDDTDQDGVDPTDESTWKPVYDATCGSPCEVTAVASGAALRFDVTTEMSNPERVRDIMSKLTAARIRARTNSLLTKIDTLSIQWTRTGDYSLFPDSVYAINDALTRMQYPERLDAEDYTLIAPPGYGNYLVIDVMGKEFLGSEEYAATKQRLLSHLSDVCDGIEVVEMRDEPGTLYPALPAIATPTALSDNPCAWPLRLVHTPSAIYGSTGVIETGIESSPSLARMNKRQWFQEEWTLLTKHGAPQWAKITLTSAASGSRAAASTKLACG
jgi:hypothetical protein